MCRVVKELKALHEVRARWQATVRGRRPQVPRRNGPASPPIPLMHPQWRCRPCFHAYTHSSRCIIPDVTTVAVYGGPDASEPRDLASAKSWAQNVWTRNMARLWEHITYSQIIISWLFAMLLGVAVLTVTVVLTSVIMHPEYLVMMLAKTLKFIPRCIDYVVQRVTLQSGARAGPSYEANEWLAQPQILSKKTFNSCMRPV